MKSPSRLWLEPLEDRLPLTTFGVPWPAPDRLTVSFVPDGTVLGDRQSTLLSWLDDQLGAATGQREILRAFQSWLAEVNLNIGLVADSGLPAGTAGALQGDTRFGDFRIAAVPFFLTPGGDSDTLLVEELAVAAPFDPLAGTWAGDITLNRNQFFGPGGLDLYTVLLHEVGHVLGLDHSEDLDSALFEHYLVARLGPSAADITRLQELYGVRLPDAFDAQADNGLTGTPSKVTLSGQGITTLDADLTTATDVDRYSFKLPGNADKVVLRLRAAGLSLLAGHLEVRDESGQLVVAAGASGPGADIEVFVPAGKKNGSFVVTVSASDADFAVGGYVLEFDKGDEEDPGNPSPGSPETTSPIVNLQPRQYRTDDRFDYFIDDQLAFTGETRLYRFLTPQGQGASEGPMTVFAWTAEVTGFRPRLTLLDSFGEPIEARVLVNEGGGYVLQLDEWQEGPYLLRVEGGVGAFSLGIRFEGDPVVLDTLVPATAFAPGAEATGQLHVLSSQVLHAVLTAVGDVSSSLRLEIVENTETILTLVAAGGETVTATLFLPAGDYTLRLVHVGTAPVTGELAAATLSNPIGPSARDVTYQPQTLPPGAAARGWWWEMSLPGFVVGPGPEPGTSPPPATGGTGGSPPPTGNGGTIPSGGGTPGSPVVTPEHQIPGSGSSHGSDQGTSAPAGTLPPQGPRPGGSPMRIADAVGTPATGQSARPLQDTARSLAPELAGLTLFLSSPNVALPLPGGGTGMAGATFLAAPAGPVAASRGGIPLSSGGGGSLPAEEQNGPEQPPVVVVSPRVEGLVLPVGPVRVRPATSSSEEVPVVTAQALESSPALAEGEPASEEDEVVASGASGSLRRGMELALLAGVTTAWLLHRNWRAVSGKDEMLS